MWSAADDDEPETLLVSTFYMGETVFGLPTTHVQEIVRYKGVTPVHHAPHFVMGVVNLRGKIVTVLDLAARTGFGAKSAESEGRVIILEWSDEQVGLLVDDVIDVFPVDPGALTNAPANLPAAQSGFVAGVMRHEGILVPILDVPAVMNEEMAPGSEPERLERGTTA